MTQPPDDGPPPYDPFAPPGSGPALPPPPPGFGPPAPAPPGQAPGYPGYGDPAYAYPGYAYGYAAEPERKPGTDGFSIASLIFGIIGGIPLAVIFGIVALRRIGRTRQGGKGLAVAGLVLSGVWLVIVVISVAVGVSGEADRGDNGTITTAGRVAATDLKVGDCIQFPKDTTSVKTFDAVPCSTPHDAEAYASGVVPLDGDWPGETAMQKATDTQCSDAFEGFVGVSIDDTALDVSYFYPEQDAWDNGERGYVCVVGSQATKTTGTLKGAAR